MGLLLLVAVLIAGPVVVLANRGSAPSDQQQRLLAAKAMASLSEQVTNGSVAPADQVSSAQPPTDASAAAAPNETATPPDGLTDPQGNEIHNGVTPQFQQAQVAAGIASDVTTASDSTQGPGSIAGTIADPAGSPIDGACVDVYPADAMGNPGPVASACSDAAGAYQVTGLPLAGYYIEVLDPTHLHQGASKDVDVEGAVTGEDVVLQPGGAVAGNVTDQDGKPLAGICVYADQTPNTGAVEGRGCTDSTGHFQTSGVAPGTVSLDYEDATGTYLTHSVDSVAVRVGQVTQADTVALQVGGRITGKVTDAATGAPASGLCVSVTSADHQSYGYGCSDDTGVYTTEGLPAGSYTASWYSSGAYLPPPASTTPVSVTLGKSTTLDATAALGATISGHVLAQDTGQPLSGVNVSGSGSGGYRSATTAADGSYTLAGLGYGTSNNSYSVSFYPPADSAYLTQYYDGASSYMDSKQVVLTAQSGAGGIDAHLVRGARVSGTVTSSSGTPVAGIAVSVYAPSSPYSPVAYAETGADGKYQTSAAPTGTYTVNFSDRHQRYLDQYWKGASTAAQATQVQLTAGTDVSGIDAPLHTAFTISGTVTSAVAGEKPGFVNVTAKNVDDGSTSNSYTAADGTYTVPGLAPGTYVVSFTDTSSDTVLRTQWYKNADTQDAATPVTLTDTSATGIDAALKEGTYLTGTITGSDGRPLPGACAALYLAANTNYPQKTSCADGSGTYRIGGLSADNYLVRFTAPQTEYAPQWYGGGTTAQDAAVVSVADGAHVTGIDGKLAVGGRITGTFTDPAGGSDCVAVFPAGSAGSYAYYGCVYNTTAGATWTSDPLPAGKYIVEFYPSGGQGGYSYYKNATSYDDATPVTVASGATTSGIDGAPLSGVTITGHVTDQATGAGLSSPCITAQPTGNTTGYGSTCFTDGGSWSLVLQPGTYLLSFTATGYQTQWWQGASSSAAATPVTITSGAAPGPFDVALVKGGATVTGHLTDATTHEPVQGVCVGMGYSVTSMSPKSCSDATGAYSLTLTPGSYYSTQLLVADPADTYAAEYLQLPGGENGPVVLTDGETVTADAALQVGGHLTGTVTADNNGAALPNVCVNLSSNTFVPYNSICTGSDGTFRSQAVAPGSYTVQFSNYNGRYAAEYYDDATSLQAAKSVAITSGKDTAITAGLSLGGGLAGTLTLPDGSPASGACVSLTPLASDGGDPLNTCADATGHWTSPGLRAGDWIVGAVATGYAPTWYQNATTAAQATPVTVTAGRTVSTIDVQLRNAQPTLTGVVSDASGNPVSGVCAYLYTGWDTSTGRAWCTGPDGTYKFILDAGQTYKVAVFDPQAHYRTTWGGGTTDQSQADLITAPEDGSPVTEDIALSTPSVVMVAFTHAGSPVSGICGYLYGADAESAVAGSCTGTDGKLSFGDVPTGSYVLGASDTKGRYATVWSGNAADRGSADPVTVGDSGTVDLGTLTLSAANPGRGVITGTVTDVATGAPVEGICGYVRTTSGTPSGYATCSVADGSYAVEVPTGSYTMVFSDPRARYETQALTATTSVAEGETATASVALTPVRRIEGRMVDPQGNPEQGLCVYAYASNGSTAGAYCTGEDGTWSISGLAAGSYRIGASDPAGAHATVWAGGTSLATAEPLTLSDSSPVESVGDLTSAGLGAASGTVLDGGGQPASGVCVYVDRADGTYSGVGTCTGADGRYWLGPLPEGEYTVAYYPPGSTGTSTHWYDGASSEATASRISISAGQTTSLSDQSF